MSHHQMLVAAITFTALCAVGALGFFGWLIWAMGWDLYDYWQQQRIRKLRRQYRVGEVYRHG